MSPPERISSAKGGLLSAGFIRKQAEQQNNPKNPACPVAPADGTGVNPACPACPVASENGTRVAPADGTGVK